MAAAGPGTVHLTGPAAQAAACDAMLTPVVTGQIDQAALHQLTSLWLTLHTHDHAPAGGDGHGQDPGDGQDSPDSPAHRDSQNPGDSQATADGHGDGDGRQRRPGPQRRRRPGLWRRPQ